MGRIYGYAREFLASEHGQNVCCQTCALRAEGAEEIVVERIDSEKENETPLASLLERMEESSTLMVTQVACLGCTAKRLCDILGIIQEKHLRLVILDCVTIDFRNGEGDEKSKAYVQMAGVFGELESSVMRMRVRSGMEKARAKGKQIGRKPVTKHDLPDVFLKNYRSYKNGEMTVTELAHACGLTRPTVYKYMRLMS